MRQSHSSLGRKVIGSAVASGSLNPKPLNSEKGNSRNEVYINPEPTCDLIVAGLARFAGHSSYSRPPTRKTDDRWPQRITRQRSATTCGFNAY